MLLQYKLLGLCIALGVHIAPARNALKQLFVCVGGEASGNPNYIFPFKCENFALNKMGKAYYSNTSCLNIY